MRNSQACALFKSWATARGLDYTARGSPDFWLFKAGELYAVKVRTTRKRGVRLDRRRALRTLQDRGVSTLCWAVDDEQLIEVKL